jgi:hypothetical protein
VEVCRREALGGERSRSALPKAAGPQNQKSAVFQSGTAAAMRRASSRPSRWLTSTCSVTPASSARWRTLLMNTASGALVL